jgi:prephenate dehydrogenase
VRLTVLGLGLVGGSVARAAVRAGWHVRAWTPSGEGPQAAARDGIEPADAIADAVAGAELVVLAAPPLACLQLIDTLSADARPWLGADTVVTDVASTKAAIVDRGRAGGLRFVGGHPLAGRETTGYAASDPDLFVDRPWVIVPPEPGDAVAEARVEALVAACRARPVRMPAAEHDRAVAAISHLPLLLSAALTESIVEAPGWTAARALAAGGWASMTRLARGDAEMGAGILATNAGEVAARLETLLVVLDRWADELGAVDAGAFRARLERAREALDEGAS